MSTPEGWYADPQRPGVPGAERWWNGASWTAHTRERPPPGLDPRQVPVTPASTPPPARLRAWTDLPGALSEAAFQLWDQLTRNPVARERTTADGEPLAPPVVRGLAWAMDLVLVAVLAVVVKVVVGVVRFAVDASDGSASFSSGGPAFAPGVVAVWLAVFAYHALFLRVRGATPGKMLLNLTVRRTDSPGRLPWSVVLRRVLLSTLGAADASIALVPLVGGLSVIASLFPFVDKAAVLATKRQQALHDLWAGTQVVQRPRGMRPPEE